MDREFTDTERLDWMAEITERTGGMPRAEYRAHLDARIAAERAAQAGEAKGWVDLIIDFPPDETPVRVQASDEQEGVVCYDSTAGDWYMHCPGAEVHGRLWSEVHGPESEILRWHR